jgi:hypothetical protein
MTKKDVRTGDRMLSDVIDPVALVLLLVAVVYLVMAIAYGR